MSAIGSFTSRGPGFTPLPRRQLAPPINYPRYPGRPVGYPAGPVGFNRRPPHLGLPPEVQKDELPEKIGSSAVASTAEASSEPALVLPEPTPVVFWGICDVKYDSRLPKERRVKVLEIGDGRCSKFSNHGKCIKERFENEYCYSYNRIKRSAMVENKKFAHDSFLRENVGHLRPRTGCYPRRYDPNLAARIASDLQIDKTGAAVLKLCNRARGAGVVIARPSDLDSVLRRLLMPPSPSELETWLIEREAGILQRSFEGLEEACQHWWANECPHFVAEACCNSQPVEMDDGSKRLFDGTLRVSFALIRRRSSPGKTSNGEYRSNHEASQIIEDFEVDWLGGYWKLPSQALADMEDWQELLAEEQDSTPESLHARLVSSFNTNEKRTAAVEEAHLQEISDVLTPALQAIFRTGAMCVASIMSMYREDKLFCSFVLARTAADLRSAGKNLRKANGLFDMARNMVPKSGGEYSHAECAVLSYIERSLAVTPITNGEWNRAIPLLEQSLAWLPTNATSYYFLGWIFQKQSKFNNAVTYLQRCILLDPDFKLPFVVLSTCFLQMEQFQDAIDTGMAGLRRHPDSMLMKYNIGQATCHLMQKGVISENVETEDHQALQKSARHFLDCARRNVPDQWTEADQGLLAYLDAAPEERAKFPKRPVTTWKVFGWRP